MLLSSVKQGQRILKSLPLFIIPQAPLVQLHVK